MANNFGHKEVHFEIEAGGEGTGELLELFKKRKKKDGWPGVDFSFSSKGLRPLETTDVLAYECTKRAVFRHNEVLRTR